MRNYTKRQEEVISSVSHGLQLFLSMSGWSIKDQIGFLQIVIDVAQEMISNLFDAYFEENEGDKNDEENHNEN